MLPEVQLRLAALKLLKQIDLAFGKPELAVLAVMMPELVAVMPVEQVGKPMHHAVLPEVQLRLAVLELVDQSGLPFGKPELAVLAVVAPELVAMMLIEHMIQALGQLALRGVQLRLAVLEPSDQIKLTLGVLEFAPMLVEVLAGVLLAGIVLAMMLPVMAVGTIVPAVMLAVLAIMTAGMVTLSPVVIPLAAAVG